METEYFQSVLYEMMDISYQKDLRNFIIGQLENDDLYNDNDKVPLPKLITFIYRLQSQGILMKKLKTFEIEGVQEQIGNLEKLVYFEDEDFLEVELNDILSSRGGSGNMLEDLLDGELDISSLLKSLTSQ